MSSPRQWLSIAAMLFALSLDAAGVEAFRVDSFEPSHKTQGVELEPMIQIHLSGPFDAATVNEAAVRLVRRQDKKPTPVSVSGDLGGVVTVSVDSPLDTATEYQLEVTEALRSQVGNSIEPASIVFRTTDQTPQGIRPDVAGFRFTKSRISRLDGVCGLGLHESTLFACTWDGKLMAYPLGADGTSAGPPQLLLEQKRRFNAIVADPASTPEHIVLWLSHDSQHRLSLGPNDFSGTIARVDYRPVRHARASVNVEDPTVTLTDVITGLPTGDHPASGLTFGPDGRLYVSQGALSMLGGKAEVPETPLSAATLAIQLQHPLYTRELPVNVRFYDAETNPDALHVFATGIREAFDLCWHSSGSLFAGVNMNDTNEKTPARNGLPALSVRPDEMMIRIVEGQYYGHPNPARKEWVLLGGNPTNGTDPWEVPELPVGTKPEPNFDPSLLIRNLEKDKGPSADGVCEWTADGPLKGRLLFCFYTATRGIHTYQVTRDGKGIADHHPLVDPGDRVLRFGAPLDVVHDPRGWLYVADFSAPERGDSGRSGGVWLVRPSKPQGWRLAIVHHSMHPQGLYACSLYIPTSSHDEEWPEVLLTLRDRMDRKMGEVVLGAVSYGLIGNMKRFDFWLNPELTRNSQLLFNLKSRDEPVRITLGDYRSVRKVGDEKVFEPIK